MSSEDSKQVKEAKQLIEQFNRDLHLEPLKEKVEAYKKVCTRHCGRYAKLADDEPNFKRAISLLTDAITKREAELQAQRADGDASPGPEAHTMRDTDAGASTSEAARIWASQREEDANGLAVNDIFKESGSGRNRSQGHRAANSALGSNAAKHQGSTQRLVGLTRSTVPAEPREPRVEAVPGTAFYDGESAPARLATGPPWNKKQTKNINPPALKAAGGPKAQGSKRVAPGGAGRGQFNDASAVLKRTSLKPPPDTFAALNDTKLRNGSIGGKPMDEPDEIEASPPRPRASEPPRARKAAAAKDNEPIDLADSDDDVAAVVPAAAAPRSRAKKAKVPSKTELELALPGYSCVYPPTGGLGSVEVKPADLKTLEDTEFVNDTIIDYYSKVIQDRYKQWREMGITKRQLHFFNAFFFKKFTEKGKHTKDATPQQHYERVKNWTKKVDIFTMDFIFVPVHDTAHWSLAVICHPGNLHPAALQQAATSSDFADWEHKTEAERDAVLAKPPRPCILHLDPIVDGGHETSHVAKNLRSWLRLEWLHSAQERPGTVPAEAAIWQEERAKEGLTASVLDAHNDVQWDAPDGLRNVVLSKKMTDIPSQDNYHDCGLYTLTYTEFFAYRTPKHVHLFGKLGVLTWSGDELSFPNFLRRKWFKTVNGNNLRRSLMWDLLHAMCERQRERGPALSEEEQHILEAAYERLSRFPAVNSGEPARYNEPGEVEKRPELQGDDEGVIAAINQNRDLTNGALVVGTSSSAATPARPRSTRAAAAKAQETFAVHAAAEEAEAAEEAATEAAAPAAASDDDFDLGDVGPSSQPKPPERKSAKRPRPPKSDKVRELKRFCNDSSASPSHDEHDADLQRALAASAAEAEARRAPAPLRCA